MSYTEKDTDILLLVAGGDELKAKDLLRSMTPAELRDLRQFCSRFDEWLDDICLERRATRKDAGNE